MMKTLNKSTLKDIRCLSYQATVLELCPIPIANGFFIPPNCHDVKVSSYMVTTELRNRVRDEWAICFAGQCFDKSTLDFEYEALPSNRSDDFLANTRFNSSFEAVSFWMENYENYLNKLLEENSNLPIGEWVMTSDKHPNGEIKWTFKRYIEGHKSVYFTESKK